MSERAVVVMAVAAGGGALSAWRVPWPVALVVVVAGLLTWRPVAVTAAAFVVCAALAARAEAGLTRPSSGAVQGWATLVSDPRQAAGAAWRVDVDLDGRRLQAWARAGAAAEVRHRLAGEQIFVRGTVSPLDDRSAARLRWRHISGRLAIDEIASHRPGAHRARVANAIRRTLTRGAVSLGDDDRALLAGFVLGDDRDQPASLADDFRASGLTHLLAVSGQNVAFVLLIAGPVLQRLGPRSRVAGVAAVLVLFGTVTRWEPSVIRAVAMAAVSVWATHRGTPASSVRMLSLAVTALLLIDPLLVHSIGFLLSVGACLGIGLLSGPLSRRLPGPRWLTLPAGVTIAAQAGVSPILVPVFGGVPLASLPANLLAAPAAGPVMVWGLAAGLAAGVLGPPFDGVLHLPTGLLLRWMRWVAGTFGGLPLGELGAIHVCLLGGVAAVAWRWQRALRFAWMVAVVVALQPVWASLGSSDVDGIPLARDVALWRRGDATVLVVHGEPPAARLLEGLRRRRVYRLDVVVLSGRSSLAVLDALRGRHSVRRIAAPAAAEITGAAHIEVGDLVRVGDLRLVVEQVQPRVRLAVAHGDGRSSGGG